MSHLLYSSRVSGVKFNLASAAEITKRSHALIKYYDAFRNGIPYAGGVYDAHLGTTDHSYRCQTCNNNKRGCTGHAGHARLSYPVWIPIAITDGRKWLKLVCHHCGLPVIDESQYAHFPRSKRLDEASKIARVGNKRCLNSDCRKIHPTVKKDPKEPLALISKMPNDPEERTIYPHQALEILSKITDETIIKLGKNPNSRPANFVTYDIVIPPVNIRPDVKKIGGGRSTNDDLTTMLQIIIKKSEGMPTAIPKKIPDNLRKSIFELNNSYYDFVKANGEASMNSLAKRFKGKQGRFRKNQMGKRVRNICRSFIVGDPKTKIDEVCLPMMFARTVQVQEMVTEFNKHRLLTYVQNGRSKYPGASQIIKKNTGIEYDVMSADLEIGDTILRDIIDGDYVNFNRQPSLLVSNISAHRAKIIRDPNIKTIKMNVIACALFGADLKAYPRL